VNTKDYQEEFFTTEFHGGKESFHIKTPCSSVVFILCAFVRNFQIKVAFQMPIIEVGSSHDR